MDLRYQEQDCGLTLREGIAEYHAYLGAIGRKAMVDHAGSRLFLEHDAPHFLFYVQEKAGRKIYAPLFPGRRRFFP